MKSKSFEKLFFSKTHEFLDEYLLRQCSRSAHTVKAYRDALTVFRRYIGHKGLSLKTFGFEDCSRDFLLGFLEYLQNKGYEKSSCNQRLAAIKSYMWYVADSDISLQQNALMVSRVPFLKEAEKECHYQHGAPQGTLQNDAAGYRHGKAIHCQTGRQQPDF